MTRDFQERDDAARQSQQQMEQREQSDSAEQRRHAAEIESLRSELQAARNQGVKQQQQDDERQLQEQQQQQQQQLVHQQQQQLLQHQLSVLRGNVARLEQVTSHFSHMTCDLLLLMYDV